MNRLKNMNGYSKYLYGSIMDIFRKMTCPDKMKTRKICSDFLLPFATKYQHSLSSSVRFVAIDIQGDDLFEILNDKKNTRPARFVSMPRNANGNTCWCPAMEAALIPGNAGWKNRAARWRSRRSRHSKHTGWKCFAPFHRRLSP